MFFFLALVLSKLFFFGFWVKYFFSKAQCANLKQKQALVHRFVLDYKCTCVYICFVGRKHLKWNYIYCVIFLYDMILVLSWKIFYLVLIYRYCYNVFLFFYLELKWMWYNTILLFLLCAYVVEFGKVEFRFITQFNKIFGIGII